MLSVDRKESVKIGNTADVIVIGNLTIVRIDKLGAGVVKVRFIGGILVT